MAKSCHGDWNISRTKPQGRALFAMLEEARHQLDQIARQVPVIELPFQDLLPAVATGARRAGQGEEIGAAGDTARGARLDRRGLDLLIRNPAEQFAEPVDLLLEQALEGFR